MGESNYQPALREVAGGRMVPEGALDRAIEAVAYLVPEPDNPHDRHAVRVDIDGKKVGYIGRHDAPGYHVAAMALRREGLVGWCPARVMGGGRLRYGVYLHLGPPHRALITNSTEDMEVIDGEQMVVVTRTADHQDVLGRLRHVDRDGVFMPIAVGLGASEIDRGKYRGEQCIEVFLDGDRIGELTYRMSVRYLPSLREVLDRGRQPGCEAFVQKTKDKGIRAHLLMPGSTTRSANDGR